MALEEVLFVRELIPKTIRAQGNITIVLDTQNQTTGGVVIKDSVGFTVARIDSSGNFHMKGNVLKDL